MYEKEAGQVLIGASQGYDSPKLARAPSMKSRIEEAVREAEARLSEAKRAREIFDAHPELEELLNIMQRGRF